jgi:hypothetical protein
VPVQQLFCPVLKPHYKKKKKKKKKKERKKIL